MAPATNVGSLEGDPIIVILELRVDESRSLIASLEADGSIANSSGYDGGIELHSTHIRSTVYLMVRKMQSSHGE